MGNIKGMTDEESYNLMLKYTTEETLLKTKEMLRNIGVNETWKLLVKAYGDQVLPPDFLSWMHQSLTYLNKKMQQPLN